MSIITTPADPATRQTAAERDFTRRIRDEIDLWYWIGTLDEVRARARRIGYYLPVRPISWCDPIWARASGDCTIGAMQQATGWTPPDSARFADHWLSASSLSSDGKPGLLQRRLESLRQTEMSSQEMRWGSSSELQPTSTRQHPDVSTRERHPDDWFGFSDADRQGVEKLDNFRTTRLRCQICTILRLKMDNGEIDPLDFHALSQ